MNKLEKGLVEIVAKTAPWLAPFPSAYFVARSGIAHLALPVLVAIIVAAIIETLGIATVHTALWHADWNTHKRKSDPTAPTVLAASLAGVYFVTTIGLTVLLEIAPSLSTFAPALFPALAIVGSVNLALISRQRQREEAVKEESEQRKAERQSRRKAGAAAGHARASSIGLNTADFNASLDVARQARKSNVDARVGALLTFYLDNPDAGPTEAGVAIGVSRQTVYTYLDRLEREGRIARGANGRVQVCEGQNGHNRV